MKTHVNSPVTSGRLTYVYDALKKFPVGSELWASRIGTVRLVCLNDISKERPIEVFADSLDSVISFSPDGKFDPWSENLNIHLWPSRDCRSWKDI